jgi:hypothetical protein
MNYQLSLHFERVSRLDAFIFQRLALTEVLIFPFGVVDEASSQCTIVQLNVTINSHSMFDRELEICV